MAVPILQLGTLSVRFRTDAGELPAVNGVSLDLLSGENLAIVGESGAGKSQLFHAVMGLLARNGTASGSVRLEGREILNLPARALNRIRGSRMAMVFQDPMTALNPYLTIGRQLTEVLEVHQGAGRKAARQAAIEMLERVRIPAAARRFKVCPHELSGGMRQRVMIAMALLCKPRLLIADEPTTALDVTVQAEIMALFRELAETGIVLVTHDLPLVAGLCDRVIVMYAGRIVESGPLDDIFYRPRHPYTARLLAATPAQAVNTGERLVAIPGQPPDPARLPEGCAFHPRCHRAVARCGKVTPQLTPVDTGHRVACLREQA